MIPVLTKSTSTSNSNKKYEKPMEDTEEIDDVTSISKSINEQIDDPFSQFNSVTLRYGGEFEDLNQSPMYNPDSSAYTSVAYTMTSNNENSFRQKSFLKR